MRHMTPFSHRWEDSMRHIVSSLPMVGGQYAPHCALFSQRWEGCMRFIDPVSPIGKRAVCASWTLTVLRGIPRVYTT